MSARSKTFIDIVTGRMGSRALSLRRVAREVGLDPSFFSKVLSGKRSPPSDQKVLTRLAKCLEVDARTLIVSTGVIPSDLRPYMESPDFLRRLDNAGTDAGGGRYERTILRGKQEDRAAGNDRGQVIEGRPSGYRRGALGRGRSQETSKTWIPRSPELSEDLL